MAGLTIHGIGAAPGIGRGLAFLYTGPCLADVEPGRTPLPLPDRAAEIERFRDAARSAAAQLAEVGVQVAARAGSAEAAVFEAQTLFLEDPSLIEATETAIRIDGRTALGAVRQEFERAARDLDAIDDDYLRARSADLRDVKERLAGILGAVSAGNLSDMPSGSVVLARDLTPSDTAALDPECVRGILLAEGAPTAHAAILARGLGLPLVVGAGPSIWQVAAGQDLLLDGSEGTVLVEPGEEEISSALFGNGSLAAPTIHGPAQTADGRRVHVLANAGTPAEVRLALRNGAEGIGLLRTEFMLPILQAVQTPPDEDALADAYGAILEPMGSRPVIVRSLDAGGDKPLPFLDFQAEANPFLGWRGIRVLLDRPEIFASQTRALLRAAARHGTDLGLMFPMVGCVDEFLEARELVEKVSHDARIELRSPLRLGVMIEVPSAALIADALAREADFFSLGTNDLVQYTLACDRGNARVTDRCRFWHPAVLRLVDMTVSAAHARGRPVGVCGEAAGDPLGLPLLVGLEVDDLSLSPARIPECRRRLSGLRYDPLREIAGEALTKGSPEEVESLLAEL